jgi:hypothetical protein
VVGWVKTPRSVLLLLVGALRTVPGVLVNGENPVGSVEPPKFIHGREKFFSPFAVRSLFA